MAFKGNSPTLEIMQSQKVDVGIFSYSYKESHIFIKKEGSKDLLKLIKAIIDVPMYFKENVDGLVCFEAKEAFPYLIRCLEKNSSFTVIEEF
ncbi:MAG: hypothetical protein NTY12_01555 [Candidatus Falkowbacteria bacterium]|nr:hypothetical protein [Candidatus Falkowbacteria bacterium]